MSGEVEKWIALSLTPGLGPRRIAALWRSEGGIGQVFSGSAAEVAETLNISLAQAGRLLAAVDCKGARQLLDRCRQLDIAVCTLACRCYPRLLKETYDPPPVIYYRGHLRQGDLLAVVGSRKATAYGREAVRRLVAPLCQAGVGVVSGLAVGIDAAAHRTCVDAGGYTVAVLGNGLDIAYPPQNAGLQQQIARSGCLVTEFPPGTRPHPAHFPRRNRLISGLSRGILVVEAAEKSGAMITVNYALEQGRDVYAVPGNITSSQSRGTNLLIQQGAMPVLSASDILADFGLEQPAGPRESGHSLSPEQRQVLAVLDGQGVALDSICHLTGLSGRQVLALLVGLELEGLVRRLPGQQYARSRELEVEN